MADVLEMSLFAETSSHVQLVALVADVCWAGHFLSETFRSRWPCCVDVPMAPGLHV